MGCLLPDRPSARITAPEDEGSLFQVSTFASNLPEHGDQFPQGSQHILGAVTPQRCAGVGKKPRDPGGQRRNGRRGLESPFASQPPPTKFTHRESLKLLRTPGFSPGVGCWKQELFTLQTRPCSQGTVPADGNGLFGKWPGGGGGGRDNCSESLSLLLSAH